MMKFLNEWRAARWIKRSRYKSALEDMPTALFGYWAYTAGKEFKGIPRDAFFYARAAEGLMAFFDCVHHSHKRCALPSKAADSVWHAWMRWSQADLNAFCYKHFRRHIPHVEAAQMREEMDAALANTLVKARVLEGHTAVSTAVPALFALDRKLRMPFGYAYGRRKGEMAFSDMDASGKPLAELAVAGALLPGGLLAAGLISLGTYSQYEERQRKAKEDGGGGCGSGCGSDCGTSGGDGGGSGCGGGCGGGD
jgi:hypothetical protein